MLKLNYKKIAGFVISLSILVIIPLLVSFAQVVPPLVTIHNPLGSDTMEIKDLLLKIMNLVATIGGIVVVFFIIYSGFKFVMARGNPAELEKARDMLLFTVIGGAILLGADVIANVVVNTVKATTGAK